jgi:hypothetical protein
MCAALPEDWIFDIDAASVLEAEQERFGPVIERIAIQVAAADPANPPVDDIVTVTQMHVLKGVALLREAADALEHSIPRRSQTGIFISYSYRAEDRRFARELAGKLKRKGFDPFLAPASVEPATNWLEAILQGLRDCQAVVFIVTPSALESDFCKLELGAALALGKPIVPALRHVAVEKLPEVLRQFQAIDIQATGYAAQLADRLKGLCELSDSSDT